MVEVASSIAASVKSLTARFNFLNMKKLCDGIYHKDIKYTFTRVPPTGPYHLFRHRDTPKGPPRVHQGPGTATCY